MKYRTVLLSIVASLTAMTIRSADVEQPRVLSVSHNSIELASLDDSYTWSPQQAYTAAAVFPLSYTASVRNVVRENGRVREEIDALLVIAVLAGLVITQLRRSQDRLQRPFGDA